MYARLLARVPEEENAGSIDFPRPVPSPPGRLGRTPAQNFGYFIKLHPQPAIYSIFGGVPQSGRRLRPSPQTNPPGP